MSHLTRLSLVLLLAPMLLAEGQAVPDTDLPEPFDEGVATELLTRSPFTRIVNLEETLQLTGIAYVDGRPVATFLNRATNERVTISEEPNPQGWRITEAIPGAGLQDTEVHVMIGGEEVTMHYGTAQLTPGGSKKGAPGTYATKPGSKGDDHIKTSSFLGENGRELYGALSREARDRLKDAVHEHRAKYPEQTPEQHAAYAQKIYGKIKTADQKSTGGVPSVKSSNKTPKPNKKK